MNQPGSTSTEQNIKAQKELFERQQRVYRDLIVRIDNIEAKIKHVLPSIHHQVTSEKIRKILQTNPDAELENSISDAKVIATSLGELIKIEQDLQNFQKTNNKTEIQKLKTQIENKTGDVATLNMDIVFMEENIKILSHVNKEIRRIEKTVIKAHSVMKEMKTNFDKIKHAINEKPKAIKNKPS